MQLSSRSLRWPLAWLAAVALLLAQAVGLAHGQVHGAAHAATHADGESAFDAHDEGSADCRLLDQLAHADTLPAAPLLLAAPVSRSRAGATRASAVADAQPPRSCARGPPLHLA